jgi:1-acyl-sn-glycerol-3-phosphate acyltransferase
LTMYLQGHYLVDRGNPVKAKRVIDFLKGELLSGRNLFIYPEGTRSLDGKIAQFKRGSMKLALESGASIVPCYIDGTNERLPKRSLIPRAGVMSIRFGMPIAVQEMTAEQRPNEKALSRDLAEKVRKAVIALGQIRTSV